MKDYLIPYQTKMKVNFAKMQNVKYTYKRDKK